MKTFFRSFSVAWGEGGRSGRKNPQQDQDLQHWPIEECKVKIYNMQRLINLFNLIASGASNNLSSAGTPPAGTKLEGGRGEQLLLQHVAEHTVWEEQWREAPIQIERSKSTTP